MSRPVYPIRRVSELELRDIFNASGYLERLERCELEAVILEQHHPAPPLAGEPICTWSRSYSLRERKTGVEMARLHQYDRPDGTIGLSGKPDPKRVLKDGVLYRLHKKNQASPSS